MRAYLVRHAQTVANQERRHQSPQEPLSVEGIEQAKQLGKGLGRLIYDREVRVLCSDAVRAQQTAQIACDAIGIDYETTGLLREIGRPSKLHGTQLDDPGAREIKNEINSNLGSPKYRHSDEETFFDVRQRVNELFETYFATDTQQNLVFITHAVFMKAIVARALYGANYTPEQYKLIYSGLGSSDNAAISQIVCRDGKWRIAYWNNFSHLIEEG